MLLYTYMYIVTFPTFKLNDISDTYTLFTLQVKPNRARPEPNQTVLALQYKLVWPGMVWLG